MLCCLVRLYKKIKRLLTRVAKAVARSAEQHLRQAWAGHHERVVTNTTYAAVTATMLAGALGLVPVKDVLSAVLGAVLGVYATSQRGRNRGANTWSADWA